MSSSCWLVFLLLSREISLLLIFLCISFNAVIIKPEEEFDLDLVAILFPSTIANPSPEQVVVVLFDISEEFEVEKNEEEPLDTLMVLSLAFR